MTAVNTDDNGRSGPSPLQRWSVPGRCRKKSSGRPGSLLAQDLLHHAPPVFGRAISLRAAALTYSIVLSVVPLLALSTAILKGMGGGDQLRVAAKRLGHQKAD